jgi:signal recognition particle GTPase
MSDTNLDELQKKLDKALASIEALESKNKELLTEKQKAKADADEARAAADETAAEKEREAKDIAAIEKRLTEKHSKELAKLKTDLQSRDQQLSTLLIDNAIAQSLTQNNVAPQFAKAVTAMLKSDARIENGVAMLGDTDINEGIKAYFTSDEGKAFVAAPANSGAAAIGSRAAGTTVPDKWNLTQYASLKNESPDQAAAYAAKHGKSFD